MSIPESALNYGSILTLLGENAEVNGKLNNKSITFTHIAIGDGNDQYVQPSRTQTTLVNEITRIPVTGMEKIEPSEEGGIPQLKVWAKIPDNIVDVAVREFAAIAVYDGNSYLHAVGNSVRIPILSGVNNGGEVNDIYIEMTFAVTSLDPIIQIDPTIVTATRKYVDDKDAKHLAAPDPHPQYLEDADMILHQSSQDAHPQYAKLSVLVGLIATFHTSLPLPGWHDLKGGTLSRITDKLLFEYAQTSGLWISQATKDSDPIKYAMYFGDGDGAATFTLPNHHFGHFIRGNPDGVAHGETQSDAIRNIYGSLTGFGSANGMAEPLDPQGAFARFNSGTNSVLSGTTGLSNNYGFSFDASKVVPTADENRPLTANLSMKIFRGWI